MERGTTSILCENRYCFSVTRWRRVRDASLKPASNELVSCSKRVHFGLHFRSYERQTLFLDLKQGDCSDFSGDFAREKCGAVKGIQIGFYPGLILTELLERANLCEHGLAVVARKAIFIWAWISPICSEICCGQKAIVVSASVVRNQPAAGLRPARSEKVRTSSVSGCSCAASSASNRLRSAASPSHMASRNAGRFSAGFSGASANKTSSRFGFMWKSSRGW